MSQQVLFEGCDPKPLPPEDEAPIEVEPDPEPVLPPPGPPLLINGDCIAEMAKLPAASVHAVICDPPYGINFLGKDWDRHKAKPQPGDLSPEDAVGFELWTRRWASEAFRVLKPGGHLLAFGGTRMFHRAASGIEGAGFEIRDCLTWLYSTGMPKSLDVPTAIDKSKGVKRKGVGTWGVWGTERKEGADTPLHRQRAQTPEARAWKGWGTALKPCWEPIIMARKPLIGTVAQNVLAHATGGINVDATRLGSTGGTVTDGVPNHKNEVYGKGMGGCKVVVGRWPSNVMCDAEAAELLDAEIGPKGGGFVKPFKAKNREGYSGGWPETHTGGGHEPEAGPPSRFFYVAKPSTGDKFSELPKRFDSAKWTSMHPTVKPVSLMLQLIKLVTPRNGTVLDPFLGSGSTGRAAMQGGFGFIGIEMDPDYYEIARYRVLGGDLMVSSGAEIGG